MDAYIRNFDLSPIETVSTDSVNTCSNLLKNNVADFTIVHKNIRSINKNLDEFKILLHQINHEFDCIVFSETWRIEDADLYRLPGFHLLYNNGQINQNDGLVVYIAETLSYDYKVVDIGVIKAIQVTVFHCNKRLLITAIYRPPSTCPRDFNLNLYEYVKNCRRDVDVHVFVGDINIDILSSEEAAEDYLNILNEEGFVSTINNYTRIQNNSKSCLDHIFLRQKHTVVEKSIPIILKTNITDHFLVLLQLRFVGKKGVKNAQDTKTYLNVNQLLADLEGEDWSDIYNEVNVNTATDIFTYKIKNYIEKSSREIKTRGYRKTPWITCGLIRSISTKNKLYKKMVCNPSDENKNRFRKYRNALNLLIKITKRNYYQKQIHCNKNDSARLWNSVKEMCDGNVKIPIKNIKTAEGKLVTTDREISDAFVNFFTNIGGELSNKIRKCPQRNNIPDTKRVKHSIFLRPTNKTEVAKIITNLKDHKTPGNDNLRSEQLKAITGYISAPLAYIINKSFELGIFPNQFKSTVIVPIFKKGDKLDVTNYRPISLITSFAKVYEKILYQRLTSFFNKYSILSPKQYGFREGRSTSDAIIHLSTNIYKALNARKPSMAVFVDLAKAFDTVNHAQLLEILERVGVRGTAHDLLCSYLSNREQQVKINGCMSEVKTIQFGVPQGTVLGPLLFNIYINDLFEIKTGGDVVSFADDTAVFFSGDDWNSLRANVQQEMSKFLHYFKNKLLTVSVAKTCYVPFTSLSSNLPSYSSLDIDAQCPCDGVIINATDKIKYLGVYIDPHLRWGVHTEYVTKKIRSLLHKFKHFKKYFTDAQLKTLYIALIEPHLTYGNIAWGGTTKNHLRSLEVVQKWVLKIIHRKEYTYPTELLFSESNVFDIRQLFCYSVLMKQHTVKKFIPADHNYPLRSLDNFSQIPRVDKTVTQRSFYYLGPKLYSKLPADLKVLNSLSLFKKRLRVWMQSKSRLEIHSMVDMKNV